MLIQCFNQVTMLLAHRKKINHTYDELTEVVAYTADCTNMS
jgi:hypothetical protein